MKQADVPGSPAPHFLTAPGELGARIRAHDWSRTPLGPIEQWPHSLKTVVSLMLSSHQPMWIGWGPQATFLYNDAYIDVLSMAKHPWALGRPAAEVWAEIWDICGPLSDRVFQHGEATLANDVRLFMSRGDFLEEVFYSFSYSPVRDESGNVAGLFCPNLDVTAKHLNARRMLTLSEMSTRTRDEKTVSGACTSIMASLANNADDLPFALLYLDGAAAQMAGYAGDGAPSAAPSASPVLVQATHEGIDDQAFPLAAVMAAGVARTVALPPATPGLPRGLAGQQLRDALVLPLMGSAQQAVGALVLGASAARRLDADYRRFMELVAIQAGAAIQHARAAEDERLRADMLAQLDRAKTQFFSNVSHEFRTPLTLMLGPMDDALADRVEPLPPAQRARLALMRRNGLRLQKLVNTLLEFSRVQAGRARAHYAPVDLSALTADLASSFRSAVEGAGMRLLVDCPPLPERVYVDPALWEKIVLNLVSNAFKFTFEGHIAVSLEAVGRHVYLAVSDTGTGIPADQLPHLFERFHRVEGARSRTHEGSGIGLALVHDLVALHGGRIGVESAVGEGTVFTVEIALGCAHLDPEQVMEAPATPHRLTAASSFVAEAEGWVQRAETLEEDGVTHPRRGRLLIVDDNADMRDYLRRLLSGHWYVEVCRNGAEALAAVARRPPDVVLSDVMMPELDGFGLLAALRADPATRDIAFMLLSARAGEEARLEGLQAGADDYLVKPFSGRELAARLDVLRERQQARVVESAVARRTQSIFSQAPVAIAFLRGERLVFEQANDSYRALVGQRPLDGLSVRAAFPELEGQGIFELLDGVYATGQPYIGRAVPVRLRPAPGQQLAERSFDFIYQPLAGDDGRPEGVAMVVFEVTELASAKRAAEAANRAKDEFLAMLGHELRNPLAPIVTALQLMRLRGARDMERECAVIERQTRHLVALVDDLLDVSRVAQGKITLRRQPVQMAEVVTRAIETASPLMEQKRHKLTVDLPADGLPLVADAGRCVQVVANLLTNAAKYTEAGGAIAVRACCEGDHAVVAVSDNGIGIAADMLEAIFDRFVQERQALSRSQGGLGLGLTIVKSMVTLHGGSVHAHSDGEGHGSTFTIRLPLTAPQAGVPAAAVAAPAGDDVHASESAGKRRVMVVDDNEDAASAIGELLELQGYAVCVAFGAPDALVQAPRFQPDICLLDIGLPGMDGYELAQRLRQQHGASVASAGQPPWSAQPLRLVALTGYGQDSDRRQAAAAGFDRHLTKPVDFEMLATLLRD